jgi:hypothetical protein
MLEQLMQMFFHQVALTSAKAKQAGSGAGGSHVRQ